MVRISSSLVVSVITLVLGIVFQKPGLWLPLSVLTASIIYSVAGTWAKSEKVGSAATLSIVLKLLFNVIGFYATIGQIVCVIWLLRWFVL